MFTEVKKARRLRLVRGPSEIISNRVCGIWLGIGEGANVIISK